MNKLAYLAISSSLLGLSSAFAQPQGGTPVPATLELAPGSAASTVAPQYAPAGGAPVAPHYAPAPGGAPVPHYAPAGGAPGAPHYAPVQGGAPVPHYAPTQGGVPALQYAPSATSAPGVAGPDPRGVRAPRTQAVDPIGTANAPRLDPRVASAPRR